MFKEHDINGEQGLLYLLKDSEVLQSFHLAMLTTNPHIGAIPLQCTYVENHEAIYYKTGHLISVERYLHENRVIHLSWIMKGLAETVKQLMGYQLFPENMCLDSRYVFLDLQSRKVHLIYIPLKTQVYEAKSKLVALLRQWLDQYVNQSSLNLQGGMDFNPMMMKLVLSLQQETTSFASLLDLMCELGLETGEAAKGPTINNLQEPPIEVIRQDDDEADYSKFDLRDNFKKENLKKENVKKENVKSKNLKKTNAKKVNSIPKGILVLVPIGILIMGLMLSPLALETKLGGALILSAGSVWSIQKFKLLNFSPKERPKEQLSSSPQPSSPIYPNHFPSQGTGEYPVRQEIGKAEETLWIDHNSKNGVLMLRSELGSKFVTLNKEVTTLGRNPSLCDVMIDEAGVGRIHAEIHKNEDKYYIKDIQSLNGSYVNGKKIPSNQYYELSSGDQIKIGSKEVIFT